MAKKVSKSQQPAPVKTDSGVEYYAVAADTAEALLSHLNRLTEDGWQVLTIVDRPGVCRAWMRRER